MHMYIYYPFIVYLQKLTLCFADGTEAGAAEEGAVDAEEAEVLREAVAEAAVEEAEEEAEANPNKSNFILPTDCHVLTYSKLHAGRCFKI